MRLLIDSDSFCKLGACGLLTDVARLLDVPVSQCVRLAALPHMLSRGRLRKTLGDTLADRLRTISLSLEVVPMHSSKWLDVLSALDGIDPGEAQLFSYVAEHDAWLLTGDKRALRALKPIEPLAAALNGKLITLEFVLIGLLSVFTEDGLRSQLAPTFELDKIIKICFSGTGGAREALDSYAKALQRDVAPVELWKPTGWRDAE